MKKYLLLFLSVFSLYSCSDELPEEEPTVRAGRTILAYMISNNGGSNLDSDLKKNLVDMYSGLVATKDTCTLLVYYRPYSNDKSLDGPSILMFTSDGKGNINNKPALVGNELNVGNVIKRAVVTSYGQEKNHNATDPKTMKRVFEQMKELSPSESYGLIFGSHGTGWMEGNAIKGRAFGDDAGYNIDIPEMADVLEYVFDKPLDFILFDACMMATAEVCYELREATNYLIGSVVETHVYGNPYDVIIPKLYEKNIRYRDICKDYIDYSMNMSAWGVSAAIDCNKMDELAGWVKDNLSNYSEALETLELGKVQQYGVGSYKYFSFDIIDLFKTLNNGTVPSELQKTIERVVIAKEGLYGEQYKVVGNLLIEKDRYCGIGMYLPSRGIKSSWDEYYKSSISWYKDAGWEDYFKNIQN